MKSSAEITAAWAAASVEPRRNVPPRTAEYVEALAKGYRNGTVTYAAFDLTLDKWVFDRAVRHDNWRDAQLLDLFWLVPGVADCLPKLGKIQSELERFFDPADVFELASTLGKVLHNGGAYSHHPRTAVATHLALGAACAGELLPDDASLAFVSTQAWCQFFLDVAWDFSVLVVSPLEQRIKVLLATDTD